MRRKIVEEAEAKQLIEEAEKIMAKLNAYFRFVATSQRTSPPKKPPTQNE